MTDGPPRADNDGLRVVAHALAAAVPMATLSAALTVVVLGDLYLNRTW